MKLRRLITGGILLGASLCTLGESKNIYYQENFEDVANTDFFSKAEVQPKHISEATGKKAISGSTSLVLNSIGEKGDYPRLLRFPKDGLEGGRFYEITFKCKLLKHLKDSVTCFALMEGNFNGKFQRLNTTMFGKDDSNVTVIARVPIGGKAFFDITSTAGGVELVIDDLKIVTFEAPKESDWMFEKDAFLGMRFLPTDPNFMDLNLPMYTMTKEQFFPFIDKYGQFKHKDWIGKIHSQEDFKQRIDEEQKFFAKHPPIKNRDEFFGLIDDNHKYDATGKFRVQKVDGKWFFITPKGNLFWSLGIDCVGGFPSTPIDKRETYFEDISNKKYIHTAWWGKFMYEGKHQVYAFCQQNVDLKYPEKASAYGKISAPRMASWGLNTYGAWTSLKVLSEQDIPYSLIINSIKPMKLESKKKLVAYWQPFPDYFDPKFETETMRIAKEHAAYIQSPYCMGVFVDNELPWQNKDLETAKAVLACPATQPSKIAFKDMMENKYKSIDALNKVWGAKYANWEDLLKQDEYVPTTKEAEADMVAFERKIYERYYNVCRNAIKTVSPDTLYFGCRLAWTNELCGVVASEICDVVSYNLYRNDVKGYKLPEGSQDKPIIIGEYHFGNQDRGVFGGGLRPKKTMKEKVDAYEKYTISAIENPQIVGAHWFQWFDQCTTSRSDGENYSIGFVDICDTPAYEMAKASRKISRKMYDIRFKSKEDNSEQAKEKTTTY